MIEIRRYDPNRRNRQRAMSGFSTFLMFLTAFAVIFGVGFWLGGQYAKGRVTALDAEVRQKNEDIASLQARAVEAESQMQVAQQKLIGYQEEIELLLPAEGPMRPLAALLKKQLDQGLPPERLEFVLKSARPPSNCKDPETRRFVVSTPAYSGADSTISIDGGAILVTASGSSARNTSGAPEAWYDPSQKVKVTFAGKDGTQEEKEGFLPLSHSMIVGAREYRLTLEEGARSFIKVTFDSCDYP